ncbi:hypothetical protein Hdeb2414_s0002g00052521 [Helianthus debilis subsp. tardiflorus]
MTFSVVQKLKVLASLSLTLSTYIMRDVYLLSFVLKCICIYRYRSWSMMYLTKCW